MNSKILLLGLMWLIGMMLLFAIRRMFFRRTEDTPNDKPTANNLGIMKQMRSDGASYAEIGQKFNLGRGEVYHILHNN